MNQPQDIGLAQAKPSHLDEVGEGLLHAIEMAQVLLEAEKQQLGCLMGHGPEDEPSEVEPGTPEGSIPRLIFLARTLNDKLRYVSDMQGEVSTHIG